MYLYSLLIKREYENSLLHFCLIFIYYFSNTVLCYKIVKFLFNLFIIIIKLLITITIIIFIGKLLFTNFIQPVLNIYKFLC